MYGAIFHPLKLIPDNFPLWTDDYSDVMRVMMIKEVQKVRKAFGLRTPDHGVAAAEFRAGVTSPGWCLPKANGHA